MYIVELYCSKHIKMRMIIGGFSLILTMFILIAHATHLENRSSADTDQDQQKDAENNLLTAKIYAKLFADRRKVQQAVVKEMLKTDNYERNFKLLMLAYDKIFEVITENNKTLTNETYGPSQDGFPQSTHLQDAVVLILENCCIAAESLLHFPEISYRIFRKHTFEQWKSTFNWCIIFVNSLAHLTDESTVKLMELLQQEVNEDLRTENYVNPYYKQTNESKGTKSKRRKSRKKIQKRPQLSGGKEEL